MAAEQTARVGAQIRRYREKAGLNQRELAEALPGKTDGTQVSKWERGVNKPSDDTLNAIARTVGCKVADFYADPHDETTPDLMGALAGPSTQLDRIEGLLHEILTLLRPDDQDLERETDEADQQAASLSARTAPAVRTARHRA